MQNFAIDWRTKLVSKYVSRFYILSVYNSKTIYVVLNSHNFTICNDLQCWTNLLCNSRQCERIRWWHASFVDSDWPQLLNAVRFMTKGRNFIWRERLARQRRPEIFITKTPTCWDLTLESWNLHLWLYLLYVIKICFDSSSSPQQ